MHRRSLLKLLGVAGVATGIGYAQFQNDGQEGRVFWRHVAVDTADSPPEPLILMSEVHGDDEAVESNFHLKYRSMGGTSTQVSRTLHRKIRQRFDDEPYYLLRYEDHDCNGIPGDEGDNAVHVSRTTFNRTEVGDCIKR